jgi:AcrR family transcriptional regulator
MSELNGRTEAGVSESLSDTAVARRRRDEIVQAATEIISSQGLHRLSLAKIEKRAGMARGQLTYYFRTKEDILLAVFDRMLGRMIEEAMAEAERRGAPRPGTGAAQECLREGFARMLSPDHGRRNEQLFALVHTFMAQVYHREDYRQKLAAAHANWREHLASDYATSVPDPPAVDPQVYASIVMALFQGLGGQLAVDPNAFDRGEMAATCQRLLAPLFAARPAGDSHD